MPKIYMSLLSFQNKKNFFLPKCQHWGGPFIVDKLWDSLLGYHVLLSSMLHAMEGMKLFKHLWHGFKVEIVGHLFHEWIVFVGNVFVKGVCHLVFSSFDEGVVGCYLQWCTIMMMHDVWNMLGCPLFFLEFAKLVNFVD
jgi:hypothetical protein